MKGSFFFIKIILLFNLIVVYCKEFKTKIMKNNRKNRKWKYITEKNFLRLNGCKVASWQTFSNDFFCDLNNTRLIKEELLNCLNSKVHFKMNKFNFSRFIQLSDIDLKLSQTSEDFINNTSTILASIKIKFIK